MVVTPGIIAYLDFSEASLSTGTWTFPYNVQKKLVQASQVWVLNYPKGDVVFNAPCVWNPDGGGLTFNGSEFFAVSGNTLSPPA